MKFSLLLSAALALLASSCAQPKYLNSPFSAAKGEQRLETCEAQFASGHCVSIAWELMPTETEYGSFVFKTYRPNLADASPVPVDLAQDIAIVLWMPGMGHGSSPVKVERVDMGTYLATEVFFTMKGAWEIRVQLKNNAVLKDQALVPITL